ncbi:MAG: ClpXP protease specificity-enhancing factor SspB [Beijerinckiaceae bacterium]|nr:ClpXP protease specificity-enhancing factor SspB [Beijerinckiaceae bacterium]
MNDSPSEDLIRYDVMVQEALLGVVRKVLQDAAKSGLPGEHHFYITFRSQAPGVRLSTRLREKYPEEMTIVLQHQFWDLIVGDHNFEVGLSFGGVPERLLVPYEALTGFYDPSVQFGLKFSPDEAQADNDSGEDPEEPTVKDQLEAIATLESGKSRKRTAPEPSTVQENSDPKQAEAVEKVPTGRKSRAKPVAPATPEDEKPAAGGAEVVSLEAFRKKK